MALPARYRGAGYRAWLSEDLGALIESKDLSLSNLQKGYVRSRWLQQVLRLDYELQRALKKYQVLRLATALGCLVILMLVSVGFDEARLGAWATTVRYLTILLTLLVSGSVVIEHLFNYGQRWRDTEHNLERLQTEGWRFLQLSGHYRHYENHAAAFSAFVNQVEELSQHEIEVYSSRVLHERRKGGGAAATSDADDEKKSEAPPTQETAAAGRVETPTVHTRDQIAPRRVHLPRGQ
ncbi:MAG TPA: DUF4231 domain-containing protein [Pyrinomonadaceae bacterium]|jgi:hypothetical protein|nr:DUF4231 domain-containing protein [Pyrinomonadaceae bacterium]